MARNVGVSIFVRRVVPVGWCEHLTVLRCSGKLERSDGPEGWCEYLGAPRCSGRLVRTSYYVQMFRQVGAVIWPGGLV